MTEPTYYAIPDPDEADRMTYWRLGGRGLMKAWPTKARYGPTLWNRPGEGRDHVVPGGLTSAERREWVKRWTMEIRWAYLRRVLAAIEVDPVDAAGRFAVLTTRCGWCGRQLTDEASKTYGIGPDCRKPLHPEVLAASSEAVGRAHAAAVKRLNNAA